MTTLPINVLIAAAGQPALLRRTLKSLAECSRPVGYTGTLVVENGPRTGLKAIVESFAPRHRFRYCYVSEANKSYALNVALSQILGGLVVFLDDDVRVSPGLLEAYAAGAAGVERGEFYGGPLPIDCEGASPPEWLYPYLPKTARGWRLDYQQKSHVEKGIFLGPNWAAFATDLQKIGGFEPRLGPGAKTGSTGQESDAQRRLRSVGVQSYYLPDAEAWHYVREECFTPEWIIARIRRHSREWGIQRGRRRSFVKLHSLYYAVRRAADHAYIACLRRFGSERSRFHAEYLASLWQGRYEGLRLGQSWEEVANLEALNTPRARKAA